MKHVLLISPLPNMKWAINRPDLRMQERDPHMGLFSIYSYLRSKSIPCYWVDATIEEEYESKVQELAKEACIVAVTVMTTEIPGALHVTRLAKETNPSVHVVWGGVHPTLFPEQIVRHGLVDSVCVGYGEHAVEALYNAITSRSGLEEVPNLAHLDEQGNYVRASHVHFLSLDTAPFPAYEAIPMGKYIDRGYRGKERRTFPVLTGLGCPYECTFCVNNSIYGIIGCGPRYIGKSADRIIDEVTHLVRNYGVEYVRLRDELFFIDISRLHRFLELIESSELKFSWRANCRIDYIANGRISKNLLKRCVRAGLCDLNFGIESGSDKVLREIKKGISVADVQSAVSILNELDCLMGYSFMVGLPGETSEDLLCTHELINWLRRNGRNVVIYGPQVYRPYPGCEIFNQLLHNGFALPKSLEEWSTYLYDSSQWGEKHNFVGGYIKPEFLPWIVDNACLSQITYLTRVGSVQLQDIPYLNDIVANLADARARAGIWDRIIEDNIANVTDKEISALFSTLEATHLARGG